ncbi:hypothetical protein [Nonomuraea sp. NPDC002799]
MTIADLTHEFFRPYAITFDYRSMRLTITRGQDHRAEGARTRLS